MPLTTTRLSSKTSADTPRLAASFTARFTPRANVYPTHSFDFAALPAVAPATRACCMSTPPKPPTTARVRNHFQCKKIMTGSDLSRRLWRLLSQTCKKVAVDGVSPGPIEGLAARADADGVPNERKQRNFVAMAIRGES
jgi:hypothetical protein